MDGKWRLFGFRNGEFHFNEGNMSWPWLRFTFSIGRQGVYLAVLPFRWRAAAWWIDTHMGIELGWPDIGEGWEFSRRF